jgi:hypothetical protein
MANAIRLFRLTLAPGRAVGLVWETKNGSELWKCYEGKRKIFINLKMRQTVKKPALNEHIAKIAALPRGIDILLFSRRCSR